MSYKALYDILCSVKRHMNARVIFRCHSKYNEVGTGGHGMMGWFPGPPR